MYMCNYLIRTIQIFIISALLCSNRYSKVNFSSFDILLKSEAFAFLLEFLECSYDSFGSCRSVDLAIG